MKSTRSFIQTLQSSTAHTITADIFDTILLRKVWPENVQFLEVAKRTLPLWQSAISDTMTAYEIFSWRDYVRNELLSAKRQHAHADNDVDLTLEEWFTELFSVLAAKYNGKPKSISKKLLAELIAVEMQTEKEYTKPNQEIIRALRQKKEENPKLKVFFVSDMYLTTTQVEELLRHHDVLDVFDGGITSTDAGNAKYSTRLYYQLHNDNKTFKEVDLSKNLHIGDSYHSDVAMAKNAGSDAAHYNPKRLRRARTFNGRVTMKLAKMSAARKENRNYKVALRQSRSKKTSGDIPMHDLGFLFSQPMASYLLHVGLQAKNLQEKHYIFVSSEGPTFIEAGKHLFGTLYNSPESALKLNRKRAISAVAWKLIQEKDPGVMRKLIKTIRYGEVGTNRKELYDFLLTDTYPVDEAEINAMTATKFIEKLYTDLQSAKPSQTKHLKDAYTYVHSTLPKDGKTVVICDVGWGGTVQAVYTIFAKLHNYKGAIEGLYLGVHPPSRFGLGDLPMTGYLLPNVLSRKYRPYWSAVIWEYVYTNKFQFEGDKERLREVGAGLQHGYDHFRTIHINPVEYFDKVIRKKIKRLLRHPSNAEVRSLGQIRYDFGFNDPQILRIVDTEYPIGKFWLRMLVKPKATLAILVAPNNWTGGYIKRFNLIGVPTLLKILGRLKRTYYL